ncbi:MAG: hypothetical protein ACKO1U_06750 [Bacteroidota bacterium]
MMPLKSHSAVLLYIVTLYMAAVITGCSRRSTGEEQRPDAVAKVFGYQLYADELRGVVPRSASRQDSIAITKDFIDNWVRKKIVLHKAETNLGDESKDVAQKLEEYRNSLLVYAYETELIRQKLDTSVSEQEIASYYEKNKANFELKDNIIKVIYLRLGKNSPKMDKVRDWYRRDDPKSRKLLADYCRQYAVNYYLDDETWLLFDDLLKEIPIKTYDKEQFLQNNRVLEITDNNSLYLVNIKGFMIKNSLSPLSFERNNIRQLIVNERKLKLLEEMERQAYQEALKNGEVELF